MGTLLYRIMSSVVMTVALALIVMFSRGWSNIFLPAAFSALGIVALLEFYYLMEQKGYRPLRGWGICFSVAYVFVIYLVSLNKLPKIEDLMLMPMYLAIFTAALILVLRGQIENALSTLAATLAGFLYITWLLAFNLRIVLWRPSLGTSGTVEFLDGRFFFLYFIVLLKSTDIAAYFIGSWLGRHRLSPKISPKKSIEGSIAGMVVSAALGAGLVCVVPSVDDAYATLARLLAGTPSVALQCVLGGMTGLMLSMLGQLGDLAESLWKRDAGVKDSGSYIPGMGGALDVLDSFLFAAPAMYMIMKTLDRI